MADTNTKRIFKWYSSASGYTGGFAYNAIPPAQVGAYTAYSIFAGFNTPYDVVLDSSNALYVAGARRLHSACAQLLVTRAHR